MAKPVVEIVLDRMPALVAGVKELVVNDVMVGIPGDTPPRESGYSPTDWHPITNVDLGFIHEFGAPGANIPARPHLVPAVSEIRDDVAAIFLKAARRVLDGDKGAARAGLHAAGRLGREAVKAKITSGVEPPIKDATIKARLRRRTSWSLKKRRKLFAQYEAGDGRYGTPLIDTSSYINAFTYIVRPHKS